MEPHFLIPQKLLIVSLTISLIRLTLCFFLFQIKSGDETYIFSIILNSVSCIPTIFSGILVDKMGKKKLISFGSLLAFGAILAMRWANSKMVVVTLFAIGISVSRLLGSLNRMMVMEYFPASVR